MNRNREQFDIDPTAGLHAGAALAALLATVMLLRWQAAVIPAQGLVMIVFLGLIGLVWRVRLAPPLVVLLVSAMQCRLREHWFGVIPGFDPPLHPGDMAIAGALLAFVVCQYRYLEIAERALGRRKNSLWRRLRRLPAAPPPTAQDRAAMAAVFSLQSLILAACFLPLLPLAARMFFGLLPTNPALSRAFYLPPPVLQVVAALFALGGAFLLGNAVYCYVCRLRRDPLEAELELNDLVWSELRREVEHIGRGMRRE
jgi:hypothetical protein